MLKIKQYFCKHDYKHIAKHRHVSENLYQCKKCGVYYIYHWGVAVGCKSKSPVFPLDWWEKVDD